MPIQWRYYKPSDYPVISIWWKLRGFIPYPESSLPKLGLLFEERGLPQLALFIYQTDGNFGLVEGFIGSPSWRGTPEKYQEIGKVLKSQGFNRLIALTSNKLICDILLSVGFNSAGSLQEFNWSRE